MGKTRRRRVEPTDDWEQLALLCRWPEQAAYEEAAAQVAAAGPLSVPRDVGITPRSRPTPATFGASRDRDVPVRAAGAPRR